jgi:hypothetical protein
LRQELDFDSTWEQEREAIGSQSSGTVASGDGGLSALGHDTLAGMGGGKGAQGRGGLGAQGLDGISAQELNGLGTQGSAWSVASVHRGAVGTVLRQPHTSPFILFMDVDMVMLRALNHTNFYTTLT